MVRTDVVKESEVNRMAKIVIAGKAVVVTSALKLEDINTIKQYRPNELVLKGGEKGDEPLFAITTGNVGGGSINSVGATFTSAANDGSGLATITQVAPEGIEDLKAWVADKFGGAIINLNKLEEKLPAVLEEIAAEKAAVLANISVAQ